MGDVGKVLTLGPLGVLGPLAPTAYGTKEREAARVGAVRGERSLGRGRIRRCPVLGLKFELLSHNAVRGAAGCAVLNAELLAARDFLPGRRDS